MGEILDFGYSVMKLARKSPPEAFHLALVILRGFPHFLNPTVLIFIR